MSGPMADDRRWQEANEACLAAGLAWLREGLERLATASSPSLVEDGDAARGAPGPTLADAQPLPIAIRGRLLGPFLRRGSAAPARPAAVPGPAVPAVVPPPSSAPFFTTRPPSPLPVPSELEPPTDGGPRPALLLLADRLGLGAFERHTLLLACAPEIDTRFPRLCAAAQHDPDKPFPTFALALALLPDPDWGALLPERPLRHLRLVEPRRQPGAPLIDAPLAADERVLHLLKGWTGLDPRLASLVVEEPPTPLPPSQAALARRLRAELAARDGGVAGVLHLVGADAPSRAQVAAAVAAAAGHRLLRLPAERLPSDRAEVEPLARLIRRELMLAAVALHLELGAGEPSPGAVEAVRGLAAAGRPAGLVVIGAREPVAAAAEAAMPVAVKRPRPEEQLAAWTEALADGDAAPRLAGQFDLDAGTIRRVAEAAARGGAEGAGERAWRAALGLTRPALDRLAQPIEPASRLGDLVLPEAEMATLRQIDQQVRLRAEVLDGWGFRARGERGLGLSVLFAGESGTGKTMAAEALAGELGLPLYRIDLAGVVSKYIGETEKNLKELFDAAERGAGVLFFDEAEALFGKRSEVKDSHDRYANIEVGYLLQRMEAYRGLAILATNMKGALDPAFLRRLRFVVTFPFPGAAQRERLWARAFPDPEGRTSGLDPGHLARVNLAGGGIRNAALNAAFLAAARGTPVTMPIAMEAVRAELRKLDRPAGEAWPLPAREKGGGG